MWNSVFVRTIWSLILFQPANDVMTKILLHRCVLAYHLWAMLWVGIVRAEEIVPAGAANKVAQMPQAGHCEGASCLPYHPGRIAGSSGLYVDLGFANFKQSYEHPNFDPVRIRVGTPLASIGYVHKHGEQWSFALLFLPTGFGKQKIEGLPRRIAGKFESLFVEFESQSFDTDVGVAYDSGHIKFGLGLIRRQEQRKIFARRVGEDIPLVRYSGRNVFYIPTVGISWQPWTFLEASAAYRPHRIKHFKGSQKAATSDDVTSPKNIAYDPAALFTSLAYDDERWRACLSVNRIFYGRGRSQYSEGLTSSSTKADLNDINESALVLGTKLAVNTLPIQLGLAGAVQKSPWGPGFYSEDPEQQVAGVDIGSSHNVDRSTYGLWLEIPSLYQVHASLYHSFGKREVGPSGDRPGFYQTEIMGGSLSFAVEF